MEAIFICEYENCNKYLEEPIGLPCCNSICKKHVDNYIDKYRDENNNTKCAIRFKCTFCNKSHEIPDEGFPLNRRINEILKKNLHLTENEIETKNSLETFKEKLADLKLVLNDPEGFIYEYVSSQKNKVDLERERLIANIHAMSDFMIQKLNDFQIECNENIASLTKLKENHENYLNITNLKLNDWMDLIRSPNKNRIDFEATSNEINKLLSKCNQMFVELGKVLLKNKDCNFIPTNVALSHSVIGELTIKDCEMNILDSIKNVESTILNESLWVDLINLCEFESNVKLKLLYRATRDGFKGKDFHAKCDKIPKTLTIIKVKDSPNIFGGYAEATWEGYYKHKRDNNAFIFSLINKDNRAIKIDVNEPKKALWCRPDFGPSFGNGCDVYISNNSNTRSDSGQASASNLGFSFRHPIYEVGSMEAKCFLSGSETFLTEEIEVFQLQ